MDSLVVAAVVTAKDIPATLKTDKTFFEPLPLEACFACDMSYPSL
jgi:hypothetical protein